MTTWQGALVRVEDVSQLVKMAERHRIVVTDPTGPWVLVEDEPRLGKLGPPSFSKALSSEMNTSVVSFFLQTTVTNQRVEHWERGELVRELEYYLDGGGWIAQNGTPQSSPSLAKLAAMALRGTAVRGAGGRLRHRHFKQTIAASAGLIAWGPR